MNRTNKVAERQSQNAVEDGLSVEDFDEDWESGQKNCPVSITKNNRYILDSCSKLLFQIIFSEDTENSAYIAKLLFDERKLK